VVYRSGRIQGVTRPHNTSDLGEKTATLLTSIRPYQVTLPQTTSDRYGCMPKIKWSRVH
jgi:hypothetical protein